MDRLRRRRSRPIVEGLDDRCMLSASGLTPAEVATAYGLAGLTFGARAANGSGQTIAIVDAYNDPNLAAELTVFDATYGLPAPPSLKVYGQTAFAALPSNDIGWAGEEALDVEWAHALAPGAGLVLVEANSTDLSDMLAAVKTAAGLPGVTVVSMSWGGSEDLNGGYYSRTFTATGTTFVASSGDEGPSGGAQWPASSPSVLGVGGTTLQVGAGGAYQSEAAWSDGSGGNSTIETEPTYQRGVQSSGWRSTPDVAFDADPDTGVQVYSLNARSGQGSWSTVGGTSLGAPAWAALIAIADQGRALANVGTLGSVQTLTALYNLPSSDFHAIGVGYNTQTGLGTPAGASLVNHLVAYSGNPPSPVQSAGTSPTAGNPTIINQPVIGLPVIYRPITRTPVIATPVTSAPVTSAPVNAPPDTTPPDTTPPAVTPAPASTPFGLRHRARKKGVNKARSHHHGKAAVVHSLGTQPRLGSG